MKIPQIVQSLSLAACSITAVCTVCLGTAVHTSLAFAGAEDAPPMGAMFRHPDVSKTHLVFRYANNLWTVPRTGGMASPLASPAGMEANAKFSPDGETIAFEGNYEGNQDIYTVPTGGGFPFRVTYHPTTERLSDWTPDGKLMFSSNASPERYLMPKLMTVGPDGGLPEALPVPIGSLGSISPDGEWLAYTPYTRDHRSWKRYMGGLATDIWLFNLKTREAEKITDWGGTDTRPMWYKSKVYYVSDAGESHKLNIWKYDTKTGQSKQVTFYDDYDLKHASMGPGPKGKGEIVYQHGADLVLLNLSNEKDTIVEITIPGGRPTLRPQVFDASTAIHSWDPSPTAKRVAVQARGDIWSLPTENGVPRNLTRSDSVAERNPNWSPNGKWIAYASDATGEYEMYLMQSDGKGEAVQLTDGLDAWPQNTIWAPDSEKFILTDRTGRINLISVKPEELLVLDTDSAAFQSGGNSINWSHNSQYITYAKAANEDARSPSIWICNVEDGTTTQVTSGMFPDTNPTFDRKGEYLYFTSSRSFSPTYSDIDSTFIYENSGNILAVPLREDMDYIWAPEVDVVTWEDEKEEDNGADDEEAKSDDDGQDEAADDENTEEEAVVDDGVSGTWSGMATTDTGMEVDVSFNLTLDATTNAVTGTLDAGPYSGDVEGSWNPDGGQLELLLSIPDMGVQISFNLTIFDGILSGTAEAPDGDATVNCTRDAAKQDDEKDQDSKAEDETTDESFLIDYEGFERRALLLPVGNGNFGSLSVNDKNHLLYIKQGEGIKLIDIADEKPKPKDVQAGTGGYTITADGKKLLYMSGGKASIRNAASGGSGKRVTTSPMDVRIDPRNEWHQELHDVYLIFREFFYDKNMHGVDWKAAFEHYDALVDDCTTREELTFLIGELIAELNVGHAYVWGNPPGADSGPNRGTGLLGCDFELDRENNAYRISKILEGAPWDADARGPLSQPGVKVNEGDYLLAINGVSVDTTRDPWSGFVGLNSSTIVLTVSDQPTVDAEEADQREIIIKPISSESNLRYRAWVEQNRAFVAEQTGGRVGYVHVPNTGVQGQNNLIRQIQGQLETEALIVDERWNGGGQIPTRFIEILNRPATNYWAVQDGFDWKWPYDSHHGPKCMLINAPSGSGGDAFPYYFRQAGLGKLIGTRTWGGLVGINSNPLLVDGHFVRVPTFGFYELDGTWGIEGHGVDPDIEVLEDPSKMQNGNDPQLNTAIAHMLEELKTKAVTPPNRPASPNRSGMTNSGLPQQDR